tara:strand:+ start:736 stop:1050 length:315 start_codon:yes stop_codon:yes gene_type:complete
MQTLIRNSNKESLWLWEDSVTVDIGTDKIIVSGDSPPKFLITDLNSSNCTLIKDIASPDEWQSHKYIYDGGWKNNHPSDGKTYKYTPAGNPPLPTDTPGWHVVE